MDTPVDPEHESVEAFVEFLLDNDRTSFTFMEAEQVARGLGHSTPVYAIRAIREYGLQMETRVEPKSVRGFQTSSHDRWYGPGACRTHGGTGWEQITGFGGQEG